MPPTRRVDRYPKATRPIGRAISKMTTIQRLLVRLEVRARVVAVEELM
jgi:hypothetical protein